MLKTPVDLTCSIIPRLKPPMPGMAMLLGPAIPPHMEDNWPLLRPGPPPPMPMRPASPGMPPIIANGLFIPDPLDPFSKAVIDE